MDDETRKHIHVLQTAIAQLGADVQLIKKRLEGKK